MQSIRPEVSIWKDKQEVSEVTNFHVPPAGGNFRERSENTVKTFD
jgi:hypothetical protein